MKIEEATALLEYYNTWRRGAEIKMPNPTQLGIAIDTVIKHHKTNPIRTDKKKKP